MKNKFELLRENQLKVGKVTLKEVILMLLLTILIINGICSFIQLILCPDMTQMQLLLAIPDTFVWHFKTCE